MSLKSTSVREEVNEKLGLLEDEELQRILAFLQTMPPKNIVTGEDWLPLAGMLSNEEADAMQKVIEEEFGQIDRSTW